MLTAKNGQARESLFTSTSVSSFSDPVSPQQTVPEIKLLRKSQHQRLELSARCQNKT